MENEYKLPIEQKPRIAIKIYAARLAVFLGISLMNFMVVILMLSIKQSSIFSISIYLALLIGFMLSIYLYSSNRKVDKGSGQDIDLKLSIFDRVSNLEMAVRHFQQSEMIDQYVMEFFGEESNLQMVNSTWALLEVSKSDDANIRRKAVKALGAIREPVESVSHRLKEISQLDEDRKVRREAYEALTNIQVAPQTKTETPGKIILESISSSVVNLDYVILLTPLDKNCKLIGELSNKLTKRSFEICVALGWRLEYISIQPDLLEWIVNVPPTTSPSYLAHKIRQHTSETIFANFPHLEKSFPEGDFWAPGYLIMGGSQPVPNKLAKDFVRRVRIRQREKDKLLKHSKG
ncbi:MAG: transposase [Chloroflexota bacterium]